MWWKAVGDVVEGGRGCGGRRWEGMWYRGAAGANASVCVCVCDKGVDQGYLATVSDTCIYHWYLTNVSDTGHLTRASDKGM